MMNTSRFRPLRIDAGHFAGYFALDVGGMCVNDNLLVLYSATSFCR